LKRAYDLGYRYESLIEHHGYFFGRDYVDDDTCDPLLNIKRHVLLDPAVDLTMARMIFLPLMKYFNDEFNLNWTEKIREYFRLHEEEYTKFLALKKGENSQR